MTCNIVVVGSSWGGVSALARVLAGLPPGLSAPIVIAQHRREVQSMLSRLLQRQTGWIVRDAEDKDRLAPSTVYLAPAGYHLLVEEAGHLALSTEGPVRFARPSIDVLFESAAAAYRTGVVGVVLTGTNDDGAAGLAAIVARGGHAVVQDPATAERPAMPLAALATGIRAAVLPLDDIGPYIGRLCGTEAIPRVTERVLIVDDRPDNLLALEATLEPLGVEVTQASSGPDALRRLLQEDFAVILLDVQMPGMDGYETARMIKSRSRSSDVPIIFLTAISRELEHQLRGYEAGAVDYLAKPFDPEVLRSKVAVFISLHAQARTIEAQNHMLAERLDERDRAQAALGRHAAELQRSNAALDRFASVVGHDLLEPLHVVGGLLELVVDLHAGSLSDDGRVLVERARARAGVLAGRVAEILTEARGSVEPLRLEPIALGRLFDRACQDLAPRLAELGATVRSDPLPEVVGDEWLLGQVFSQVLGHAVQHVAAVDPAIDVGLSRRDEDWVVCVRSNGPGVDEDEAARLFATFGHVHDSGADGVLGLALCRRIVERHGGTIWIEPVASRGTNVCFTLPVTSDDGSPRVPAAG